MMEAGRPTNDEGNHPSTVSIASSTILTLLGLLNYEHRERHEGWCVHSVEDDTAIVVVLHCDYESRRHNLPNFP